VEFGGRSVLATEPMLMTAPPPGPPLQWRRLPSTHP